MGTLGASPVPATGTDTVPEPVLTVSVAVWPPTTSGENVIGTVSVSPALSVTGSVGVVVPAVNAFEAPTVSLSTDTSLMVVVPVAVKVAVVGTLLPTATEGALTAVPCSGGAPGRRP